MNKSKLKSYKTLESWAKSESAICNLAKHILKKSTLIQQIWAKNGVFSLYIPTQIWQLVNMLLFFSVKETQTTTEIMVSLTIGAFCQNLAEDLYRNYEDKKKKKKGKEIPFGRGLVLSVTALPFDLLFTT